VVLVAKTKKNLQRHLGDLADFYKQSRLQVNISKTKVMVTGTRDKSKKIPFEGKKIDVSYFKYLGLKVSSNYKSNVCIEKNYR
jgi:hypothetical protein